MMVERARVLKKSVHLKCIATEAQADPTVSMISHIMVVETLQVAEAALAVVMIDSDNHDRPLTTRTSQSATLR